MNLCGLSPVRPPVRPPVRAENRTAKPRVRLCGLFRLYAHTRAGSPAAIRAKRNHARKAHCPHSPHSEAWRAFEGAQVGAQAGAQPAHLFFARAGVFSFPLAPEKNVEEG